MKTAAAFVAGWAALLVCKYWIVGLDVWNAALHPERRFCHSCQTKLPSS